MKRFSTDFLTASGSFVLGFASAFDPSGTFFLRNSSETSEEADSVAIYSDFAMIGQDIRDIIARNPLPAAHDS